MRSRAACRSPMGSGEDGARRTGNGPAESRAVLESGGRGCPSVRERTSAKTRLAFSGGRRRPRRPHRQGTGVDSRDDPAAARASRLRPTCPASWPPCGNSNKASPPPMRRRDACHDAHAVFRDPGAETAGDVQVAGDRLLEADLRRCAVHAPQPGHARNGSSERMGSRKPVPQRDVRLARRKAARPGRCCGRAGSAATGPARRFRATGRHAQFRPLLRRRPGLVLHEARGRERRIISTRSGSTERASGRSPPAAIPISIRSICPAIATCSFRPGPRFTPSAACGPAATS